MTAHSTRIAVVLASLNRADELAAWTDRLMAQTLAPHRVIYAVVKEADLPPIEQRYRGSEIVFASVGSAHQRNRGLEKVLGDCDLVAFFDDDYVPAPSCLARAAELFATYPDVVGANGRVLADGINSPGISHVDAAHLIAAYEAAPHEPVRVLHECEGLYGCNMVYRATAIGSIRFDERLPLYAWQEDIDFAVQVGAHGRIVKSNAFAGVHLGVKSARNSGLRFGYSQIANPLYLLRKGTMSLGFALKLMARNLASNHARSLRPEPWVDRAGRLRGNWLGIADALRGRADPQRIMDL
ncbi:MAG: glycosyltransferase [Novosphingobium sp.]